MIKNIFEFGMYWLKIKRVTSFENGFNGTGYFQKYNSIKILDWFFVNFNSIWPELFQGIRLQLFLCTLKQKKIISTAWRSHSIRFYIRLSFRNWSSPWRTNFQMWCRFFRLQIFHKLERNFLCNFFGTNLSFLQEWLKQKTPPEQTLKVRNQSMNLFLRST